jgi:ribose 5-phosphate isomerase B
MTTITDAEIRSIVNKVVNRMQSPSSSYLEGNAISKRNNILDPGLPSSSVTQPDAMIVAIGSDHGGYELKENLKKIIIDEGFACVDCGTNDTNSVDYPDFAYAVAQLVSEGQANWGIIIDGAGIGSCMVANKVPGVRAALCYDYATAVNSREHNNANVLTLGAGLIGNNLAHQIVHTWLGTEFLGGRHLRRVEKIDAVERKFLRSKG